MSHLFIKIHNEDLIPIYQKAIEKFKAQRHDKHRDSGFDIFVPTDMKFPYNSLANKVDSEISCAVTNSIREPLPYYLFPRSSISKTPLRLANSVGIIDSGYRGHLIGKFDNLDHNEYCVEKHTRLLQICSHNLLPFENVTIVDELDNTKRGSGGFGSTGK